MVPVTVMVAVPGPFSVAAGTEMEGPLLVGRVRTCVEGSVEYCPSEKVVVAPLTVSCTRLGTKLAGRASVMTTPVAASLPVLVRVKV